MSGDPVKSREPRRKRTAASLNSPKHPDRVCWGCDKYCPADDLACGNGTIRTPHPIELFGDDWCDLKPEVPKAATKDQR
jgi:hypothetical protein